MRTRCLLSRARTHHTATIALAAVAAIFAAGCGSSTYTPKTVGPTIHSFIATPDRIEAGTPVVLTWSVSEADSVLIEPEVGRVATPDTGSVTVFPSGTTTYRLIAYGPYATHDAFVHVRVDFPVPACRENTLFAQTTPCLPAAFSNERAHSVEIRGSGFSPPSPTTLAAPHVRTRLRRYSRASFPDFVRVTFDGVDADTVVIVSDSLLIATAPQGLSTGVHQVYYERTNSTAPPRPIGMVIVTGPTASGFPLVGAIITDLTLTPDHNPHLLLGQTGVQYGATLRIEPGVVILASPGASLQVGSGSSIVMGEGSTPAVITARDGRDGARWQGLTLEDRSGPNYFENAFIELGGERPTGLFRVETSQTILCQTAVRGSAGDGLAIALEAGGQLTTRDLYVAQNAGAGVALDGSRGGTSGTLAGTVRENGVGVSFAGFAAGDCALWSTADVLFVANARGDRGRCP
jgi:hypothetical protein